MLDTPTNFDPFVFKPKGSTESVAAIIFHSIYKDSKGNDRWPFQGMSATEDGTHRIHGRDEELLVEVKPHLEQHLQHFFQSTVLQIEGPFETPSPDDSPQKPLDLKWKSELEPTQANLQVQRSSRYANHPRLLQLSRKTLATLIEKATTSQIHTQR